MARDAPADVWVEGSIDETSVSLTLVSEGESGVVIEEIEHVTFDELQARSGDIFKLSLSDDTKAALRPSEKQRLSEFREELLSDEADESDDLPEVGDVVHDESGQEWSNDNTLEVTEVLPDVTCAEYVIEERPFGKADETVATANPSYDNDEPVVKARYLGSNGSEYAFPASRLTQAE